MQQSLTRVGVVLNQIWLPVLLIAAWWLASAGSTSLYFPPLSTIWDTLVTSAVSGELWTQLVPSLRNLAAGLALGIVVGAALGLLIGLSRTLREILDPFLQFARSVPQVALIPIIIGALGIQAGPKIWAIGFACIWPVLLNTVDGIAAIDKGVTDFTQAYRIPLMMRVRKVILPAAAPQLAAGVRVSLSIAVVLMVVSEIYGSAEGIGYAINRSGSSFDIAATWAGTIVVGVLGYALNLLFLIIERRTLRWYHASAR